MKTKEEIESRIIEIREENKKLIKRIQSESANNEDTTYIRETMISNSVTINSFDWVLE